MDSYKSNGTTTSTFQVLGPNESTKRSRSKLAWFYVFSLLAAGACLAVLIGCVSKPAHYLYMVSFDNAMVGISGVCYQYDDGSISCYRYFPQSPGYGKQDTQLAQSAAALLILSIMLTATNIAMTSIWDRAYPKWTVTLSFIDASLVAGAAIMWTCMITANTSSGELLPVANLSWYASVGPGLFIIWGAFLLKLLITPGITWKYFLKPLLMCLKQVNKAAAAEANRLEAAENQFIRSFV